MSKFITHIFSIKNHPVCELKDRFKEQYVNGLGEFMCIMFQSDNQAQFVFNIWVHSIVKHLKLYYWQKTSNCGYINKALSVKRDGFRFFTMRRNFFFDCLYLYSILRPMALSKAFDFLHNQVGLMSKRTLRHIYKRYLCNNWDNLRQTKVSSILLNHKEINESFQKKPMKKILVVATMSAGKSTMINAIVGHKICKTAATACTSNLCYIYNKPIEDGITFQILDGGHVKYIYNRNMKQNDSVKEVGLHFNSSLTDGNICIIDTPGTNYCDDSMHGEITRNAIKSNDYDAIIFVVNSINYNSNDEADLRNYTICNSQKPIIFVLNKLDCFDPEDDSIQNVVDNLYDVLKRSKVKPIVVPLSAQYALLLKIVNNGLSKQEQIQLDRLTQLFKYDYYNLPKYCKNQQYFNDSNNEIDKTGITILENIIRNI